MRIIIGSDEKTELTDYVIAEVEKRGYEVSLVGPLKGEPKQWVDVGMEVGEQVASHAYDQGILFCYTGTGVSMAANKITGIRAALCTDAYTAAGARKWNDANILAMSLKLITKEKAAEILEAWFNTNEIDESELANIEKLKALEERQLK